MYIVQCASNFIDYEYDTLPGVHAAYQRKTRQPDISKNILLRLGYLLGRNCQIFAVRVNLK